MSGAPRDLSVKEKDLHRIVPAGYFGMGELFTPTHLIILFILGIPLLAIHFLPTIVAGVRRANNFGWILAINFFLGWTFVGWVVALIWAFRDTSRDVVAYAPPAPYNR
jgi:hypothetical protein